MLCFLLKNDNFSRRENSQMNNFYKHIHITYILNWSLQPFSQDYDLVSHTTYVVCVNFVHEWRDLQFKVDSERQIFDKVFIAIYIYSQSFCQKSAERKSPKKYFFYFILMSGLANTLPTRLLRLRSLCT